MKTSGKPQVLSGGIQEEPTGEGKKEKTTKKKTQELPPLIPIPENASDNKLMKLWRKELAALGQPVTSSSMEGKMLRDFAGKVGYENAEILIPFIVAHWQRFTWRAEADAGAYNIPNRPQIPFLLKYATQAVQLFEAEQLAQQKKLAAAPLIPSAFGTAKVKEASEAETTITAMTPSDESFNEGPTGSDPKPALGPADHPLVKYGHLFKEQTGTVNEGSTGSHSKPAVDPANHPLVKYAHFLKEQTSKSSCPPANSPGLPVSSSPEIENPDH